MKPKTLKNIYQFGTLITLSIIISLLGILFKWQLKWYYFIAIVLFSQYFGNFFYILFSGINVSNIQFFDSPDIKSQEFSINFQLGISNIYRLNGRFDNSIEIKESDISDIIYTHTTRKMLKPLILDNQPVTINYNDSGQIVKILFYEIT